MSERKVTVCQQGTAFLPEADKACAGGQWESPGYFAKTGASLLMCGKHARLSNAKGYPFGQRFVQVKPGTAPVGYWS